MRPEPHHPSGLTPDRERLPELAEELADVGDDQFRLLEYGEVATKPLDVGAGEGGAGESVEHHVGKYAVAVDDGVGQGVARTAGAWWSVTPGVPGAAPGRAE